VAHLEISDLGEEDVLELQLQQFTLAQFTIATMEHAIPLLKTGRSDRGLFLLKGKYDINELTLSVFCLSNI